MSLENILKTIYHNSFNPQFAIISAVFNGPIAAAVNYAGHTPGDILFAGLTGVIAGFISTGITARIVQHFSPIQNRVYAYMGGSLVPAAITFAITYAGHTYNESPRPFASCIAPVAISFGTSFVTNYLTRNAYKHLLLERLLPKNYPR